VSKFRRLPVSLSTACPNTPVLATTSQLARSVLSEQYAGSRMKLEFTQRKNEGILILGLKGRLVLGPEDLALRQRLQALLDAGQRNVIVDLKEVSDIDSTGLGTLLNCALKFRDSGGKQVLLNLGESKGRLPDILKLNAVFETYRDELDAVNSFFPDRKIQRYDILDFVEEQERRA
jgi:anti-sigma B factor antagonist